MRRVSSARFRRLPVSILLITALVITAGWRAMSASAVNADDLRGDIPTGEALRDELNDIADLRAELLSRLTAAEAQLADVFVERGDLDDEQRSLTAEIEASMENLRRVAVQTYVTGGPIDSLQFLADVGGANELSWRQYLVRGHAGSATVAVDRLRKLREQADEAVSATIERAEALRGEIADLEVQLALLGPRQLEAEQLLPLAEAWDRASIAIEEGPYGIAPQDKWEALRHCESTDNYAAISPSGVYRGAYQFDIPTWYTVGGRGDPAQAPPEEQDARARELYARRGDQPWPVCGALLK